MADPARSAGGRRPLLGAHRGGACCPRRGRESTWTSSWPGAAGMARALREPRPVPEPGLPARRRALLDRLDGGGRSTSFMPYADALRETAIGSCSSGPRASGSKPAQGAVGPTPLRAVGATDQHSLLQLLMEGPAGQGRPSSSRSERRASDLPIPRGSADEPDVALPRRAHLPRAALGGAAGHGGGAGRGRPPLDDPATAARSTAARAGRADDAAGDRDRLRRARCTGSTPSTSRAWRRGSGTRADSWARPGTKRTEAGAGATRPKRDPSGVV